MSQGNGQARPCANCRRRPAEKGGLCVKCRAEPSVRRAHKRPRKPADPARVSDRPRRRPLPARPTDSFPCSVERVQVYCDRVGRGEHLYHPEDRNEDMRLGLKISRDGTTDGERSNNRDLFDGEIIDIRAEAGLEPCRAGPRSFHRVLRYVRERRKLPPEALARSARTDPLTYGLWEAGKGRPDPDQLSRLCRALDVAKPDLNPA